MKLVGKREVGRQAPIVHADRQIEEEGVVAGQGEIKHSRDALLFEQYVAAIEGSMYGSPWKRSEINARLERVFRLKQCSLARAQLPRDISRRCGHPRQAPGIATSTGVRQPCDVQVGEGSSQLLAFCGVSRR
jgi:hypothetical protein